jgi:F-type H+-transporting ATPase subunit delta
LGQIAGRYASALFDLAGEAGAHDAVDHDLKRIAALIAGNAEMADLVRSPVLSREQADRAMRSILNRLSVNPLTWNFVLLLAQKRRLFTLPQIAQAFSDRLSQQRGEMSAEVVSAQPLKEGQVAALRGVLRDTYKRDVRLTTKVDPSLIGGFVLKAASRQIDTSLRSKLQALSGAMKG